MSTSARSGRSRVVRISNDGTACTSDPRDVGSVAEEYWYVDVGFDFAGQRLVVAA